MNSYKLNKFIQTVFLIFPLCLGCDIFSSRSGRSNPSPDPSEKPSFVVEPNRDSSVLSTETPPVNESVETGTPATPSIHSQKPIETSTLATPLIRSQKPIETKEPFSKPVTKSPEELKKIQEAFFTAVHEGDLQAVNSTLKAGADPRAIPDGVITSSRYENYALDRAVLKGHKPIIVRLLEIPKVKENINQLHIRYGQISGIKRQHTTFTLAVGETVKNEEDYYKKYGLEIINLLLEAGADPLIPQGEKDNLKTPLEMAGSSYEGAVAITKRLLQIPVVRENIMGRDLFFPIRMGKDSPTVNLYLDALGIKDFMFIFMSVKGRRGGISILAELSEIENLMSLPGAKEHINDRNSKGETVLLLFVRDMALNCHRYRCDFSDPYDGDFYYVFAILDVLLEFGADPFIPTIEGETAFEYAYNERNRFRIGESNRRDLEVYFIDRIKTPNEVDLYNPYQLLEFIINNKPFNSKMIKRLGMDINLVKNDNGETAFFGFIKNILNKESLSESDEEKIDSLLEAEADPLIPDKLGNTILMLAVQQGHSAIVAKLLKVSAIRENINITNEEGKNALFLAIEADNKDPNKTNRIQIIKWLEEAGAKLPNSKSGAKAISKKTLYTKNEQRTPDSSVDNLNLENKKHQKGIMQKKKLSSNSVWETVLLYLKSIFPSAK